MRKRNFLWLIALCFWTPAGFAQTNTPQQWTFVTTSESAPNADPLLGANGNPYPCTGQNQDNAGDANPNCYNPLVVTTDWTITSTAGAISSSVADTAFTMTNSSCSTSGFPASTSLTESADGEVYLATFVVTLDNGATVTFQGQVSLGSTQFTGTFSSTGGCMNGDSGNFSATLFPQVNSEYSGEFESSSGGQGVTISLATGANFNVTGTVTPDASADTCFSNMTIATTLANSYSNSFASGDTVFAIASDNSGNVVLFVASNSDANGNPIADNGLYFTYYGVAGACQGVSEVDAPFKNIRGKAPRHHRVRLAPWRETVSSDPMVISGANGDRTARGGEK